MAQEVPDTSTNKKNAFTAQYDVIFNSISLNYEREFSVRYFRTNTYFRFSAGISNNIPGDNDLGYSWLGVPVSLFLFTGEKKNHFETGITYWISMSYDYTGQEYFESSFRHLILGRIGYRFQKMYNKSIIIRTGIEVGPYISERNDKIIGIAVISPYLSAGYSF